MAVSGCILFLFVAGHLIGNLQIFEGPEKLNRYAVLLRSMPALLLSLILPSAIRSLAPTSI